MSRCNTHCSPRYMFSDGAPLDRRLESKAEPRRLQILFVFETTIVLDGTKANPGLSVAEMQKGIEAAVKAVQENPDLFAAKLNVAVVRYQCRGAGEQGHARVHVRRDAGRAALGDVECGGCELAILRQLAGCRRRQGVGHLRLPAAGLLGQV